MNEQTVRDLLAAARRHFEQLRDDLVMRQGQELRQLEQERNALETESDGVKQRIAERQSEQAAIKAKIAETERRIADILRECEKRIAAHADRENVEDAIRLLHDDLELGVTPETEPTKLRKSVERAAPLIKGFRQEHDLEIRTLVTDLTARLAEDERVRVDIETRIGEIERLRTECGLDGAGAPTNAEGSLCWSLAVDCYVSPEVIASTLAIAETSEYEAFVKMLKQRQSDAQWEMEQGLAGIEDTILQRKYME